jgi:uncharacterized membrane protein YcaP (DUF421 family)
MVGSDSSLVGGIMAAVTLLLVNTLVARLRIKWPRFRRWVDGTPTLLVNKGNIIKEHLARKVWMKTP